MTESERMAAVKAECDATPWGVPDVSWAHLQDGEFYQPPGADEFRYLTARDKDGHRYDPAVLTYVDSHGHGGQGYVSLIPPPRELRG